jgi:hypothetical protein
MQTADRFARVADAEDHVTFHRQAESGGEYGIGSPTQNGVGIEIGAASRVSFPQHGQRGQAQTSSPLTVILTFVVVVI